MNVSAVIDTPPLAVILRLLSQIWRPRVGIAVLATVVLAASLQAWVMAQIDFVFSVVGKAVIVVGTGSDRFTLMLPEGWDWVASLFFLVWLGSFGLSPLSPGIGSVAYWLIPLWCSQRPGVPGVRTALAMLDEVPGSFPTKVLIRAMVLGLPLVVVGTLIGEMLPLVAAPTAVQPTSLLEWAGQSVMWKVIAIICAVEGAALAGAGHSHSKSGLGLFIVAPLFVCQVAGYLSRVGLVRDLITVGLHLVVCLLVLWAIEVRSRRRALD